jgi:hypothetical protein
MCNKAEKSLAGKNSHDVSVGEGPMNHSLNAGYLSVHLRCAALIGTILGATIAAPQASADTTVNIQPPAAIARAGTVWQLDADQFPPSLIHPHKVTASAGSPGGASADAGAEAAENDLAVLAYQHNMIANSGAWHTVTFDDPQRRSYVMIDITVKADANIVGGYGFATWDVKLGEEVASPSVTYGDDGTIKFATTPEVGAPALWEAGGTHKRGETSGTLISYFVNLGSQQIELNTSTAGFHKTSHLSVRPGTYLFEVTAGTADQSGQSSGLAVVDPIIEAGPDNPDVKVQILRSAVDPTPLNLLGRLTLDRLSAEGFDIAAWQALGLLEPSAPQDTTPPTTVATPSPGPNANGWNNGAVAVAFASTDNPGGSGVKEIHVTLAGAATGSQIVPGGSANLSVVAEGTTTLTYFAVDNAGNQETAKTVTVRIDKTPPAISGMPGANCSLWPPDRRMVQVAAVTASDALSGVGGAPQVSATSNEPQSGADPDVVITDGRVQVRAERAGTGTGRVYTITAKASDLADNRAMVTGTCTVPHNQP